MSFGLALIDRALIDAVCRAQAISFAAAVRSNALGFEPARIAPDLKDLDTGAFLRSLTPVSAIAARHTVGMLDPLDGRDPRPDVADGLPVTLQEVIATYGHSYFKLKVGGNVEEDVARLGSQTPLGTCPKCAARVFEHGMAYTCEKAVGPGKTCDFRSGRLILQQPIEREQMKKLLATGKTDLLTAFVSKKGRRFKAFLVKQPDGKIGFEFQARAPKEPAQKTSRPGAARRARSNR